MLLIRPTRLDKFDTPGLGEGRVHLHLIGGEKGGSAKRGKQASVKHIGKRDSQRLIQICHAYI